MCSHSTRLGDIGFALTGTSSSRRVAMERRDHVVGLGGLRQVVDRAELDGLDGGGDAAVPGQHHGADLRMDRAQFREHLEAGTVGQPQVDDRVRGTAVARGAQRRRAAVRDLDAEPAARESALECAAQALVAVDEEYGS